MKQKLKARKKEITKQDAERIELTKEMMENKHKLEEQTRIAKEATTEAKTQKAQLDELKRINTESQRKINAFKHRKVEFVGGACVGQI